MHITQATVEREHQWVHDRTQITVELINDVRRTLGPNFDTCVDPVTEHAYSDEVDDVFSNGDLAVNVAAIIALLRDLDVDGDYPGFVVDELLGRELAAMIAGEQPLRLLSEATFHFTDVIHHASDETAGIDDLDAALAAGFQTRLPGWEWTKGASPFDSSLNES